MLMRAFQGEIPVISSIQGIHTELFITTNVIMKKWPFGVPVNWAIYYLQVGNSLFIPIDDYWPF
jgi:hypothetical protein